MAGMLPGVECARRRRMWQGGGAGADQAAAGTRRLSFCLYAAGHGAAHAVGTGNSGNKVCKRRAGSICRRLTFAF